MTRLVVSTSCTNDLRGFWTAVTVNPSFSNRGITFFQLEPSENAPCTSTMEGLLLFEFFILFLLVSFLFCCFHPGDGYGSEQGNDDVDVATRGFGIWTIPM